MVFKYDELQTQINIHPEFELTDPSPYSTISTEEINAFIAAQPVTSEKTARQPYRPTGELREINPYIVEDSKQLDLIAENCGIIIASALDADVKERLCEAKVATIVRMQNPVFATEECVAFEEAERLDSEFEADCGRLVRDGEVSTDVVDALENPADIFREKFSRRIEARYDIDSMYRRALSTVSKRVDPRYSDQFDTLMGCESIPLCDPTRVRAFGESVTTRVVTLA